MADYIFDDWKTMLGDFQDCVQKDLEEIHKQKAEIQQMKADLYKEMEGFKYLRPSTMRAMVTRWLSLALLRLLSP